MQTIHKIFFFKLQLLIFSQNKISSLEVNFQVVGSCASWETCRRVWPAR